LCVVGGVIRSYAALHMRQHRRVGRVVTSSWFFSALALGWGLPLLPLLAGCSAPASHGEEPRYPEKKRPEPLRSASDGEVMGANRQSPEDTLEGSPTNEHPAPGWAVEEGKLVPDREKKGGAPPPAAAPANTAPPAASPAVAPPEPEDCVKAPAGKGDTTPSATAGKKKQPCPPAEQR
jgi:hypothetical protein